MHSSRRRGFDPLGLFGSSTCLHLLPETRSQTRSAPVGLARVHSSIVRDLLSCGACARHSNQLVGQRVPSWRTLHGWQQGFLHRVPAVDSSVS